MAGGIVNFSTELEPMQSSHNTFPVPNEQLSSVTAGLRMQKPASLLEESPYIFRGLASRVYIENESQILHTAERNLEWRIFFL